MPVAPPQPGERAGCHRLAQGCLGAWGTFPGPDMQRAVRVQHYRMWSSETKFVPKLRRKGSSLNLHRYSLFIYLFIFY